MAGKPANPVQVEKYNGGEMPPNFWAVPCWTMQKFNSQILENISPYKSQNPLKNISLEAGAGYLKTMSKIIEQTITRKEKIMTDVYLKATRIRELFYIYKDLSETAQVIAREVAQMYTLDGNMGTLYPNEFVDEICEQVQPYEVVEAMEDFNHQFGYRLKYRLTSDSPEDWTFRFFMNEAERNAIYPDGE